MASRRILEDFRLFKDDGSVCTDGLITFYLGGTTTPLELFSDRNLSVSIGTSEACDVNGYAPAIFANRNLNVKCIITGTGCTSRTIDYYAQADVAQGMAQDAFTDPGSDKLIMWDESAGSGGSAVACSLDTGLSLAGTTLSLDPEISCLAGLTSAADKIAYYTGSGAAALADFTSYSRSLLTGLATSAGNPLRLINTTDAAANQGLKIESDRATPAADDSVYASFLLSDSAGTQTEFARVTAVATTVTDASEAGALDFSVMTAGALAAELRLTGAALSPYTTDGNALGTASLMWSDLFLASGGVINFNNGDVTITHSANTLTFDGNSSGCIFNAGGLTVNAGGLTVSGGGVTIDSGSVFAVTASLSTFARSSNVVASFNRDADDGVIINLNQGGSTEGTISVSGVTVSYNAFMGSHWGQFAGGAPPSNLPLGTVLEAIDEFCEWVWDRWESEGETVMRFYRGDLDPGSEYTDDLGRVHRIVRDSNDRLPRVKVSDEAGSARVYGVFFALDQENEAPDLYAAALGASFVRMAAGQNPMLGDLVESDGNGCARVQSDNLFRASTVAKITMTKRVREYDDGSFVLPCTLHCG